MHVYIYVLDLTRFCIHFQGGGKRKGSFAIYLEPWHADVEEFLELKLNHGKEEHRARDLFYALWIPDLFMKRAREHGKWSLFCPHEAPGLADVHSAEFEALYTKYEATPGLARKQVDAFKLWLTICRTQAETGTPYILYKDACNRMSNQQHLGTIRSSNLCTEIVEYTAPDEIAVCNLASINLAACLTRNADGKLVYNFNELVSIVRQLTRNLNQVIDINFYPVEEARNSNMRHRPVGIGVQALADVFAKLKIPWESIDARILNRQIFATMYYAAVRESVAIAKEVGHYESFPGSPASKGQFQFDLAGVAPLTGSFNEFCPAFDWDTLRADMIAHGMRNSLLIAPMPTASTSQILGNNECFEPYTSNLYNRRTLAGEFIVVNEHMVADFEARGLWTDEIRAQILADEGSVQNVEGIPDDLRALYKTVWEIPQKVLCQMAVDRQPYICQSQSFNVHIREPTPQKMSSLHMFMWKRGAKTSTYYLRTEPKAHPVQVTEDVDVVHKMRMRRENAGGGGGGGAAIDQECDNCGS